MNLALWLLVALASGGAVLHGLSLVQVLQDQAVELRRELFAQRAKYEHAYQVIQRIGNETERAEEAARACARGRGKAQTRRDFFAHLARAPGDDPAQALFEACWASTHPKTGE